MTRTLSHLFLAIAIVVLAFAALSGCPSRADNIGAIGATVSVPTSQAQPREARRHRHTVRRHHRMVRAKYRTPVRLAARAGVSVKPPPPIFLPVVLPVYPVTVSEPVYYPAGQAPVDVIAGAFDRLKFKRLSGPEVVPVKSGFPFGTVALGAIAILGIAGIMMVRRKAKPKPKADRPRTATIIHLYGKGRKIA